METDRGKGILPLWDDTEQFVSEEPEDAAPVKLEAFCDGWVHQFIYSGDVSLGAVYRCQDHVSEWGLEWKESDNGQARLLPKFYNGMISHQTTGLRVLEMQGLDDDTVLLVIKEKMAKSERSRIYGCILDYSKMNLVDVSQSCIERGLLLCRNNIAKWTPRQMKTQWDIIEEALKETEPSPMKVLVTAPSPSPKKKTRKPKTLAGAPGDDDKDKSKLLTLALCVKMDEPEIRKLTPKDLKVMKALYTTAFDPLYRWGKKPLTNVLGEAVRVHFDYLHKAPVASLVYRGIEEGQLKSMINKARLETDYNSEFRYITVLPMRLGPYGPNGQATFYEAEPRKELLGKNTHYYIIGGQHTVEAYKALVQQDEIQECDKELASTFEVVPIWAPRNKWNDIIMFSRALNQNIAGEQREQSFTKQLINARIKWKEMGRPQPSYGGRTHSEAYSDFFAIMSTIFTSIKGNEADAKIPLLFLHDDEDVTMWLKIEEDYMKFVLPGPEGLTPKKPETRRKPLTLNDFKPLYGLRAEDVNYLAALVESKSVGIKSSKAKGARSVLPNLQEVAGREKLIRAMKNEMMCHYLNFHLPSKKPEYVPYKDANWVNFATKKKVTRAELSLWLDKAMATEAGKKWMEGRTKNFNKTHEPKDCPQPVRDIWETYISKKAQVDVAEAMEKGFAEVYLSKTMDEHFWNISGVLAQPDVVAWRGEAKKHLYMWYLFESSPSGPRAKILEDRKLRRVFDALEFTNTNRNTVQVRSPAILMTDALGFHEILAHLQKRNQETENPLWDWHVIHYITGTEDGFPETAAGSNFNVFIIFCFGYNEVDSAVKRFKKFFPHEGSPEQVYHLRDIPEDPDTNWKRLGVPYLRAHTTLTIFAFYMEADIILVNVNGGPEITNLGMWAQVKVLEIFNSKEAAADGQILAKHIMDRYFVHSRPSQSPALSREGTPAVDRVSTANTETPANSNDPYSEKSEGTSTRRRLVILDSSPPPPLSPHVLKHPTPSTLEVAHPREPALNSEGPSKKKRRISREAENAIASMDGAGKKKRKRKTVNLNATAVATSEEAGKFTSMTVDVETNSPVAKIRKKTTKTMKKKRKIAHRAQVNLSGAFQQAQEISGEADMLRPATHDRILDALSLDDRDRAGASILLDCASRGPPNPTFVSAIPEISELHEEFMHPMKATTPSTNSPSPTEDIPQPTTVPSASGDLQMPPSPLITQGMSDSIRFDTLTDLNPFSPKSIPPPEGKAYKKSRTEDDSITVIESSVLPNVEVGMVADLVQEVEVTRLEVGKGVQLVAERVADLDDVGEEEKGADCKAARGPDMLADEKEADVREQVEGPQLEANKGPDMLAEGEDNVTRFEVEKGVELVAEKVVDLAAKEADVGAEEKGADMEAARGAHMLAKEKEDDVREQEEGPQLEANKGPGMLAEGEGSQVDGIGGELDICKGVAEEAMMIATVSDQVPRQEYTVILDLNGLLIHRIYHRTNPTVKRRPGLTTFLDWLFSRARVPFWSSATEKNMKTMLGTILSGTYVGPGEVTFFSQLDCTQSSYPNPENPDKPIFLKDLSTLLQMKEIDSVAHVLLIDDSPLKNLMNDPHNAIHPHPWHGDQTDNFFDACLRPWLDGLLKSNEAVPIYVAANPLTGCQIPEDRLSSVAFNILKGVEYT